MTWCDQSNFKRVVSVFITKDMNNTKITFGGKIFLNMKAGKIFFLYKDVETQCNDFLMR